MPAARNPSEIPIRSLRSQAFLLALWMILLTLSFPRPNLHVLAHFALVPLIILAVRSEPTRRTFLLTYLAGVFWWWFMTLWLWPVTVPGQIALVFYLGLYPLAFVAALRLINRRLHLALTLSVPVVWVSLEYLRGLIMTGFPWFLLGHSQPTFFIQIADIAGAYGVSFAVAMTNGLIADLLTQPLVRHVAPGRLKRGTPIAFSLPLWLAATCLTIGYGIFRLHDTNESLRNAPTLAVGVVQTDVPQSNKDHATHEQEDQQFDRMLQLTQRAAEAGAELVVWPETMVPRAINDESVRLYSAAANDLARYRRDTDQIAQQLGIFIVAGAHAMFDWHTDEKTGYILPRIRYNSAYLIDPDGKIAGRYDKVHRVPFGEYMPFVETFPFLRDALLKLTPYETDYTLRPGRDFTILTVLPDGADHPWRLAAPICFEDVVSYVPRRMVWNQQTKQADLLVNLSNDGWFAGTAEGPQHEQIARFRCVENRVPMARAVNTGVSSFIDSAGRILERVADPDTAKTQSVDGFAVRQVRKDSRTTFFGRVGDAFAVVTLVFGCSLTLIAATRQAFGRHRR